MKTIVVACLCMLSVVLSPLSVVAQADTTESSAELSKSLTTAFGQQDWPAAEELLLKLLAIEPDASGHLYNLVCVQSLQNGVDRALDSLAQLFGTGYSNTGQLAADSDLENIRQTTRYIQMVSELEERLSAYKAPAGEQVLTVDVPPLMECYAVMLYLGNPDHPVLTKKKDHPYLARIDTFFADYKDHELVRRLAEMYPGQPWQSNLRAHHNLRTLYIYEGLDASQIVRFPIEIKSDLAAMVQQFAEASDFAAFYKQNREFYGAMKRIILTNYAFGANVIDFFNENFAERFSRFNFYFTPLWGGWQHGPSIKVGDYQECFYFGGCLYSATREFYYPDRTMQFLALTEFDHATINPLTDQFRAQFMQYKDKLPLLNSDENSNYGTLVNTLNEYLTWAFALQFFHEHASDQYPRLKKTVNDIMLNRSFSRFDEFMTFYEQYIMDRETYGLLADFYPEVVTWLAELE